MTTTETTKTDRDFTSIVLAHGSHKTPEQGMCLLEAVAWIAGEPFSDHPACVDRALAAFGRSFNDRIRDDERQLLKPLIPMLVGTAAGPDLSRRRAYLLVDQHVRVIVPAFLRELARKPQPDLAAKLEALPPVIDAESARRARDCAREVRDALRSQIPAAAAADAAAAASIEAKE